MFSTLRHAPKLPAVPLLVAAGLGTAGVLQLSAQAEPATVRFSAADGVTVHGELYRAPASAPDSPIVFLFHQGGSDGRSEYGPLVDRLNARGYHAIAIDQRRGGSRLGGVNRTVAGLDGAEYSYCDVYPDLVGALRFADSAGFSGPRVYWGSSYSGALVFKLAAEHPRDLAAVLAFSPASGAMEGCEARRYSGTIDTPVLVLRPASETELESVRGQLEGFRAEGHRTHVADPGTHGSSMLNAERVGADTEATWQIVLQFLDEAVAAAGRVRTR